MIESSVLPSGAVPVIPSSAEPSGVETAGVETAGVLMVQNLRRGGVLDWTPPGGVIDRDEALIDGLTREVYEETGLEVLAWSGPLYEINAVAPGLGWELRVEVHRALEVVGRLEIGRDPDGIVVDAEVLAPDACDEAMRSAHRWVREPLVDWMAQRWSGSRLYNYRVDGTDPAELTVVRVDR